MEGWLEGVHGKAWMDEAGGDGWRGGQTDGRAAFGWIDRWKKLEGDGWMWGGRKGGSMWGWMDG